MRDTDEQDRSRSASSLEGGSEERQALIDLGRWVDQRGWCPATGGNLSARLRGAARPSCVVTTSGAHKGELRSEDFIDVDLHGAPLTPSEGRRPSAETLVHVALYRLSEEIGAVIHTHSVLNTVISRVSHGPQLCFQGWEMQKALAGVETHEGSCALELFDNTQDMRALSLELERRWRASGGLRWGLLVRGHGLYSWGRDIKEARRHLEAIEFLLACHRELLSLSAAGASAGPSAGPSAGASS